MGEDGEGLFIGVAFNIPQSIGATLVHVSSPKRQETHGFRPWRRQIHLTARP